MGGGKGGGIQEALSVPPAFSVLVNLESVFLSRWACLPSLEHSRCRQMAAARPPARQRLFGCCGLELPRVSSRTQFNREICGMVAPACKQAAGVCRGLSVGGGAWFRKARLCS